MPPRRQEAPADWLAQECEVVAVFTEGNKTEPQYFEGTNPKSPFLKVLCFGSKHKSSPRQILKRVKNFLEKKHRAMPSKIWIVVDRDSWDPAELDELVRWARESPRHHLAVSNPNFEYWLLLHFEDAGRLGSKECLRHLRRHISGYTKDLDARHFTLERIVLAISRGKKRDSPPCKGWPRIPGVTTVYRLMEVILEKSKRKGQPKD